MPANLTPEYEAAEQRYREAPDDVTRLDALRQMLSTIPKHKGTDKMQADIKRRISRLKKAVAKKPAKKGPDPFQVPKSGAGQVVLVGPPNAGKSQLVAATTNAPVKVAEYPFATSLPVPGMWGFEDTQIQLIDTPPITADHVPPGLMGTIRMADILAVVVNAAEAPLAGAQMVLGVLGERGLSLRSTPRNELDGSPEVRSGVLVADKCDLAPEGDLEAFAELMDSPLEILPVSGITGDGLDALLAELWRLLAVIRVYTKEPGHPADRDNPFTLPIGSTVEDLAGAIHREIPEKMRFARIWGDGRYQGQRVRKDERLHDKDVVEIHQ